MFDLIKAFKRFLILCLCLNCFSGCVSQQKKCQELLIKAKKIKYDIIVIPGVPYEKRSLNRIMLGRVLWSKFLYDKGITKNIMYSGSAVYTPYYESQIMALYAKEIGIPDSNIFIESKAKHSTENIYFSYKKAKKLGFDKIALASDPFQSGLLKRFIRKNVDPSIGVIPFVFDSLKIVENNLDELNILDSIAYEPNFISIKEGESFIKRIKGTLGKNINK